MKKAVALVAISSLLVAGAFAQTKKPVKPAKTPTTIKCPVMPNAVVNIKDATKKKMYADYKGNRYFFCCPGCPGAFKANPAKFAKMPHIKTPKA